MSETAIPDDTGGSRFGVLFRKYRALIYASATVVGLFMLAMIIDIFAEPLAANVPGVTSPKLVHESAGLLAGSAIVFALCLVLVAALWAVLLLSN